MYKYELGHNFGYYNNFITNFMENLIKNSAEKFQIQINEKKVYDKEYDILADCIYNMEEFLYYNYKKNLTDFDNIINSLNNNLNKISILEISERGIYGKTSSKEKTIYMNPNLTNSSYLTGNQRTLLYVAHELGHLINNTWMEKVLDFCQNKLDSKELSLEEAQLIYDGFSLLDEAITQNRAENFVYEITKKKRLNLQYKRNNRLFNGEPYKTNFDFYGELQEPAIMFSRTLRGIGKEDSDILALNLLSERALSPNFFDNILDEYTKDEHFDDLIKELKYMGFIKRMSYANFGAEDYRYLINSKNYLDSLKLITTQLRDYRDPINNNFYR